MPWTARRSNQSILKEIIPEYSLEGLMLKLKFQYFHYLIRRTDSSEKTLMLEKIERKRRRGRHRMIVGWHHRLNGHEFEQTLGNGEGQGSLACCGPRVHKQLDTTNLNNNNNENAKGKLPKMTAFGQNYNSDDTFDHNLPNQRFLDTSPET